MASLKIQINGKGLIPRIGGLAPKKELVKASDINFIALLLNTNGLSLKYLNPSNNKLADLTKKNMKSVWDRYCNYVPDTNVPTTPTTNPYVPNADINKADKVTNDTVVNTPVENNDTPNVIPDTASKTENDTDKSTTEKIENQETSNDNGSVKPVTSERNNNKQGNNKNNNNKNR